MPSALYFVKRALCVFLSIRYLFWPNAEITGNSRHHFQTIRLWGAIDNAAYYVYSKYYFRLLYFVPPVLNTILMLRRKRERLYAAHSAHTRTKTGNVQVIEVQISSDVWRIGQYLWELIKLKMQLVFMLRNARYILDISKSN